MATSPPPVSHSLPCGSSSARYQLLGPMTRRETHVRCDDSRKIFSRGMLTACRSPVGIRALPFLSVDRCPPTEALLVWRSEAGHGFLSLSTRDDAVAAVEQEEPEYSPT